VASDLAQRLGAFVQIVHAVDLRDFPVDPDSAEWEEDGKQELDAQMEAVRLQMEPWSVDWTFDQCHGDPARALLHAAHERKAYLIVVGRRGGSGIGLALDRLLSTSRSTSHALERHNVPVLVVPSRAGP